MNKKQHAWLVYFFTPQRPDGSVAKGFDVFTTKSTGIKLFNEAAARVKECCPGEEHPIIANISDLGESDDMPAVQDNAGKEDK